MQSDTKSNGPKWTRMPSWLLVLLTFNLSFLVIHSCGLDVEDPTSPSPPVWVKKSLPEEWPERGIDAHESGGIYLAWYPNSGSENIQEYHVYRAEHNEYDNAVSEFELISTQPASGHESQSYRDASAQPNIKLLYYLVAQDNAENTGATSDTLFYTLLRAVSAESMVPNSIDETLSSNRELRWTYNYNVAMENYVLTLLHGADRELVLRCEVQPSDYISGYESFIISDTISVLPGVPYYWRVDLSAKMVGGVESVGSESEWAVFQR